MNTALLVQGPFAGQVLAAVDPEKVKPGWLGLTVVLLMGAATYLLWRSMNRQLGRVSFDDGSGSARPRMADDDVEGGDTPAPDQPERNPPR